MMLADRLEYGRQTAVRGRNVVVIALVRVIDVIRDNAERSVNNCRIQEKGDYRCDPKCQTSRSPFFYTVIAIRSRDEKGSTARPACEPRDFQKWNQSFVSQYELPWPLSLNPSRVIVTLGNCKYR